MRFFLMLLILTPLAACGVDGEPTTPEVASKSGVSISGRAEIGVVKR